MTKEFAKIFFLTFMLLSLREGRSQEVINALPRWLLSAQGFYMTPQTTVKRFLDTDDWGYQIELQYRVQYNKPIVAGVYFSEATLSRYSVTYTESTGTGDVDIREKANTRRLEAGIVTGFYPEINWLLQPYVVGRFGMAWFLSASVLTDDDSDELIDRYQEDSHLVSSYGLDLGVHIVPNIWYIRGDIRVGMTGNPSVSFLSLNPELKGTVQYPIEAFEKHVSAGRWLKISAGVSYLF